jgi:hypothetical protein
MQELSFDSRSQIIKYLINQFNFSEEDAEFFDYDLFDYEEVQEKNNTWCSGYFLDENKDVYYFVSFLNDYGNSDYTLDITPLKREKHEETVIVTKFTYTKVKE